MLNNQKIKSSRSLFVTTCRRICSLFVLITCLQVVNVTPIQAQCPMCRMTAESNLKNGGTAGKGLNNGILYMLLTPYILIGTIGFVWYRNQRKEEDIIMDNEIEK